MNPTRSQSAIDLDKVGLMNGSPKVGDGSLRSTKTEEVSTRDQVLPILAYCAASVMMTVVNKVSSQLEMKKELIVSSSYQEHILL